LRTAVLFFSVKPELDGKPEGRAFTAQGGTLPANPTIQPLSRPDQRPGEVLASRVGTAPLNNLSYFS
jgi:hypothetical protein